MTQEKALRAWTEGKKVRLMSHLATLQRNWDKQREVLAEVERQIENVRLQVQLYDEFLSQASVILSGADDDEHDDRPSPTEAVDNLVAASPGIKRSAIIERLDGKVRSTSPEPKRVLSAVVSRGKADKKYFITRNGRVYLYDHPDAIEARGSLAGFMEPEDALKE